MKLVPLAATSLLALAGPLVRAETVLVDDKVAVRATGIQVPVRGASMKAVEGQFGAPGTRHAAVGKPPITRWDYPGFAVYFEYNHVVHAVATAP